MAPREAKPRRRRDDERCLTDLRVIRLDLVRPCKGSDGIQLGVVTTAGEELLATKMGFEEEVLDWFRRVAQGLAAGLNIELEEVDGGIDA
jgi:hypothetical protein